MRSMILALAAVGGLLLAAEASTEEYTIVAGSLVYANARESRTLTGGLQLRVPGESIGDSTVYIIDDFEFQAGNQTFLPSLPIEYDERLAALFLQIGNGIQFGPRGVGFFYFRSGGDLVEANDDEVTFRFFDFRPGSSSQGPLGGQLPGDEAPRRFHLRGVLNQVDQRFRIQEDSCPEIEIDPLTGLPGVIITRPPDGGVIIERPSFPVPPNDGVVITRLPPNDRVVITLPTRPLRPDDGVIILRPLPPGGVAITTANGQGKRFRSSEPFEVPETALSFSNLMRSMASALPVPTLEELNITAPDGAEVSIDGDGSLNVHSSGDIYLEGPIPETPGVTRIRIVVLGDIIATPDFEVPAGLTLELESGGSIEFPGGVEIPGPDEIPGDLVPDPIPCPIFRGLIPLFPADETELGSFSMIVSVANQAVEVELLPRRETNRLRLGAHKPVWVALYGSDELDVSDVDRHSLRLGPADGEPIARYGRPLVFRWDLNRDGHRDLFAVFKQRELGITHGDVALCLRAETHSGITLEGCDRIETRRARPRRIFGRHESESSHRRFHHRH
ncbi:MAG: hypothetical protein VCC19_13190 [Myxococcota bacterium]